MHSFNAINDKNRTANNRSEKSIFSVSQLNRRAKQLLETHLPLIWVSGEISNLAQPSSGHWYFSLKDDRSQVKCAMFKGANQRLRWQPKSGKQVLVRARVSIYEGRGDYQLIVEHMEDSGAGALQLAYDVLKNKLKAEGLFDDSNKQALPTYPKHIGIITSPTGAAIKDILSVLKRRYPIAPVTILPCSVQGENAAPEMIKALQKATRFNQFDLIIITRGGGSIEDLWAFNNEELARSIASCPIPVISAVGHETDFTICDFVADVRAPTPSVSAELATPDIEEYHLVLDSWQQDLVKLQAKQIRQKQQQLLFLSKRLRHPGERIKHQQQSIEQYKKTLTKAIQLRLERTNQELISIKSRQKQQNPRLLIEDYQNTLEQGHSQLKKAIAKHLDHKRRQLISTTQLLNAVNPLDILARGFSVASNAENIILRDTKTLTKGDEINTRLAKGSFTSKITNITR